MKTLLFVLAITVVPIVMGLTAGTVVTNHILCDDFSTEINFDTANEIEFRKVAGEDLSINLGTSNTATLTSDSGVTSLAMGDVDSLSGVDDVTFDNGAEINNDNDNRVEITENSESLEFIFGTNKVELGGGSTGTATLDFNDVDALEDVESITGDATGSLYGFHREIEHVVADDTLTTAESGKVFVVWNDTDGISLTLPAVGAADAGCHFIVVDANETAASDVTMEPGTGDSINGAAANVGFSSDGADELPCACMFIYYHDNTDWVALPMQLTTAWDSDGS